ncbi:psbP domain-containing protein 2, chloroplastic [Carica papaya]|uniref:psbP domain-containing protein 2, chloroplastic n=1 Tax=Carica papaya TaxID=3649 RepID=UPI000B8CC3D6|nr:psbP domain-containing protein 2, chloroplastic [Carica papaya]
MALQACSFLSSNQCHNPPYFPNFSRTKTLLSVSAPRFPFLSQIHALKTGIDNDRKALLPSLCFSRRNLSFPILALLVNGFLLKDSIAMENQELQLERYTDVKEGFTLLRPSSWIKVDKAGATVLFEEANKGSNNVGVVVNPVRLSSLEEFGSPQFVADKLIQAEKRKESTKDAEVIRVAERSGQSGVQVYEFEYKVDSSRGGMKRIFSAAFVASKKLYLLNIAHSDKPENPLDTHTRMMLEEIIHSFDGFNMQLNK